MTRSSKRPKNNLLRAAARRLATSDDSGASLLMALIFVTVVAVVVATILSFVDVSMRNTIAVRTEAARAAAADGAAQITINTLRKGNFGGTGQCFGPSAPNLSLANVYPAPGTGYSATVTCAMDSPHSAASTGGVAINSHNKPGNAILTLGTGGEDGINLMANGSNSIGVHGSIFSNSNIVVDQLSSNAAVTARGACTGTITAAQKLCGIGPGPNQDPDYQLPTGPTALQSVPGCQGPLKKVTFIPGRYTDLAALNTLTKFCNGIFYFPPGTYYFDLGGEWLLDNGYLVGGTPMPGEVVNGIAPDMPGSCQTPVPPDLIPPGGWINPGPGKGVEFVFGGTSRLHLKHGSMEICGSYSTDLPPLAVYGLKANVGPVPAESGCILVIGGAGCPVISSDHAPGSEMLIQGTTYVPNAAVDIQINNASGQVFRYGIIARHLSVSATASANLTGPIIEVPDDAPPGDLRTVVYLAIYVCAGAGPCTASGTPQLKVKVGIDDPTGTPVAGARQITIYDWSVQR